MLDSPSNIPLRSLSRVHAACKIPGMFCLQVCDFGRENIIVVGNVHTQKQYPRNFDLGSITIPRMCATERQPRLTWKKKFLFYLSSFFSLCWEIVSLNPPFTYSQRVVGGVNDAIALYLFSLLTNRRSTRRMPD